MKKTYEITVFEKDDTIRYRITDIRTFDRAMWMFEEKCRYYLHMGFTITLDLTDGNTRMQIEYTET